MLTLSSIDWVITKSIGSNVTLVGTPAYHKKASDRRSLQLTLNWIPAGSIVTILDFSPQVFVSQFKVQPGLSWYLGIILPQNPSFFVKTIFQ